MIFLHAFLEYSTYAAVVAYIAWSFTTKIVNPWNWKQNSRELYTTCVIVFGVIAAFFVTVDHYKGANSWQAGYEYARARE